MFARRSRRGLASRRIDEALFHEFPSLPGRSNTEAFDEGTPQECAELVLFLPSDEASFISGAEIAIDGGYIAAGLAGLRNRVRDGYQS